MSVVTFSRSAFSSRVTQLRSMPGFRFLKSSVSFCIRIMSPLLTVAMVSVVSARLGPAIAMAIAPKRVTKVHFIGSSQLLWANALFWGECSHRIHPAVKRDREGRTGSGDRSRSGGERLGGCFVGNEAADKLADQCALYGSQLRRSHRGADYRGRTDFSDRHAHDALIGMACQNSSVA